MYTKIYYIAINSVKTWCGHTRTLNAITAMIAIMMTTMRTMLMCLAFNLNRITDNICYYCWPQYKIICVHHFHHLDMFSIFSPSTFGRWFIASILNCCTTLYPVDDLYISFIYYIIYIIYYILHIIYYILYTIHIYVCMYMYICISIICIPHEYIIESTSIYFD